MTCSDARSLFLLLFAAGSLAACAANGASPPVATPADSSISGARAAAVAVAGAESTSEPPVLDAGDEPIVDASPPDIAGTYVGTAEDRVSGVGAKAVLTFTLHQSGSSISGTASFNATAGGGTNKTYALDGTVAKTTRGAIVHFTLADPSGQNVGGWVKIIGAALAGKGWVDPVPSTGAPYEQLLFWAHKT
jgi:hypothetical protein